MNSPKVYLVWFLTLLLLSNVTFAQETELAKLYAIPYIGKIEGAANIDRLAFVANEQGRRNIYIADGPDRVIKKVTHFDEDDAQEITSLSISDDGNWIVFVRGGEHGGNSSATAINPASLIENTSIEVFSLSLVDNKLYKIGVGDYPIFHPDNKSISYLRSGQIWTSPVNKGSAGKPLFHMRGTAGNMQWSPDGTQLAFVSRRGTHSFIGIYARESSRIRWIAPSLYTDGFPQWSPDGSKLVFLRREASGGAIDSLTVSKFQPWSIILADLRADIITEMYKAPSVKEASYPRIGGGVNLRWKNANYISFMSYEDGWPHLYRLDVRSKDVNQLTKGEFAVDNISYDAKGENIVFAANTGNDKFDFERSHIGMVDVESGKLTMLTQGEGIETSPFFYNSDKLIAFSASTYDKPVQPTVYELHDAKQHIVAGELFKGLNTNFVKPEQVFITSEDGIKFSAQYFKSTTTEKKKPALVYIHGGPRRQMYLGWHHIDYYFYDYIMNQYLVQQGYTVLSVNYRMGTGYGYDFQHPKSAGNLGASEYLDILAAGKWLREQHDIDQNRIGVFGGSYGGYLTAMALAKNSDIFKAGVDIHGVHTRQRKQNPDFYAPDFDLATKLNWDSSPSRWVDGWKSPVLLIHGDHDLNVAFSQSIDLFNRLKDKNVDVEVLVLPDETHHWHLFEHVVKVKEATVDFFNRKLK